MKTGYLQFKPEFGKPKMNLEKVREMISDHNFDLLVIPELSNSGYLFSSMEELDTSSESPDKGKFCEMLKTVSKEKESVYSCRFSAKVHYTKERRYFSILQYLFILLVSSGFTERRICFTTKNLFPSGKQRVLDI